MIQCREVFMNTEVKLQNKELQQNQQFTRQKQSKPRQASPEIFTNKTIRTLFQFIVNKSELEFQIIQHGEIPTEKQRQISTKNFYSKSKS